MIQDQDLRGPVAELMASPAAGFILNGTYYRGRELMDLRKREISYPMVERWLEQLVADGEDTTLEMLLNDVQAAYDEVWEVMCQSENSPGDISSDSEWESDDL